jgi:methionyl aminopeptidase
MLRLKNERELAGIRESCALLSEVLLKLRPAVMAGTATRDIDAYARELIQKGGGRPAFLGYQNYPAALCISVNETVIHGIPSKRRLKEGDIVGLDCGIEYRGFFSDAALTLPIGRISEEAARLMRVTRECLELAIAAARFGDRINDISRAVSSHARANGYGVVREYCGHGVGFSTHEDPQVPNYVGRGPNPRLKEGMVLAIEPMINQGGDEIEVLEDGWSVVTLDRRLSAHFEHSVAILRDRTEILTHWE